LPDQCQTASYAPLYVCTSSVWVNGIWCCANVLLLFVVIIIVLEKSDLFAVVGLLVFIPPVLNDHWRGNDFRLGEQKLVKNNQNNQAQNITLCNMYF